MSRKPIILVDGLVTIYQGDVMHEMAKIEDETIDCCVLSPPYWGLRDYGVAGQIGLERTLSEHVHVIVAVFREIRRVLKPSGTVWLNYGDCYAAAPNGRSAADTKALGRDDRTFRDKPFSTVGPIYDQSHQGSRNNNPNVGGVSKKGQAPRQGAIVAGGFLKPKDLCMIPNRIAIALQDDGWWVRSEIIWHKLNPMPERVTDRPTQAHEKLFLLTKSERYWYDAEAIKEPVTGNARPRAGKNSRENVDRVPDTRKRLGRVKAQGNMMAKTSDLVETRNARNVWSLASQPFADAHFATFPVEIPLRCIAAGCPPGGMVLDPFAGAGTTGLVAAKMGRRATLVELSKEYVAIARRRIVAEAGE